MKTQTSRRTVLAAALAVAGVFGFTAPAFADVRFSEFGGVLTVFAPTNYAGKAIKVLWDDSETAGVYAKTNTICDAVDANGGTYTFDMAAAGIANGTTLHFQTCTRYKVLDKLYQPKGSYVLTGIKDADTYGVRMGVQPDGSGFIFGTYGEDSTKPFAIKVTNTAMTSLQIYINGAGSVNSSCTSGKILDIAATNNVLTIDGVKVNNSNITTSPVGTAGNGSHQRSMAIGWLNGLSNQTNGGYWSYLQFEDENGDPLLDYVPVEVCSSGTIGFYDRVSGAMATKSGSGSFTAGTETGEYIETDAEILSQTVTASRILDVASEEGLITVTVPSALAGERIIVAWDSEDKGTDLADWANSATLTDSATAGDLTARLGRLGVKNGNWVRVFAANAYKTMDKLYQPAGAYVDTGVKDSQTYGIRMGLQAETTGGWIFGTVNGSPSTTFAIQVANSTTLTVYVNWTGKNITDYSSKINDIAVTNTVLTVDGELKYSGLVTSPIGTAGDLTKRTMTVGCINGFAQRYAKGYWSYLQLDNSDGSLMLDYIPVQRVSDDKVGFYDRVTHTFVMPSGTFTACDSMLSLSRPLLAIPGSVFSEQSSGCNHLIAERLASAVHDEDSFRRWL